jgi:hypothetical protein
MYDLCAHKILRLQRNENATNATSSSLKVLRDSVFSMLEATLNKRQRYSSLNLLSRARVRMQFVKDQEA